MEANSGTSTNPTSNDQSESLAETSAPDHPTKHAESPDPDEDELDDLDGMPMK